VLTFTGYQVLVKSLLAIPDFFGSYVPDFAALHGHLEAALELTCDRVVN